MTAPSDDHLATLCALAARHMRTAPPGDQDVATSLPWLSLIRRVAPTPTGYGMLSPSICLLLQGEKEMLVGEQVLRYGPGSYVQAGMMIPACGRVIDASQAAPYYGIRVDLDPRDVAAVMLEMGPPSGPEPDNGPALTVEQADDALREVFVRLLRLLDRPADLPVLGRLIRQELIYQLLRAPGGASLRSGAAGGQRGRGVGDAINWIRTHYNEPLSIDTLARTVHMSPSVLHRRFKAATVMSPLQYQKQVRLLEARKMLMSGNVEAASVAFDVGYESPSQFSREYRRLFGAPPLKDAERFRQQPVVLEP